MATAKTLLIILDGFGIGKDSPFNAINNAKMPFYREIASKYPRSQLVTHGRAVGLPEGVMGNSEVGHMTIGSGRIIYQDLTRISNAIADRSFFSNQVLIETIKSGSKKTGRVHLMGLLSDGGVHSHIDHLLALIDMCASLSVPKVCIHAFLDGRDTPPNASFSYLEKLFNHPLFHKKDKASTTVSIATVSGRFWAMDRDKRWERVTKAYSALTGQASAYSDNTNFSSAVNAVRKSHENGKTDEFVEPLIIDQESTMHDGDSVIFYNFRADRAREITKALTAADFVEFDRVRGFKPSAFACMTKYDNSLKDVEVAFGPQNIDNIFGEWLEKHNATQFRIAETEKYAHVTFFFNCGRETPFKGEDRLLISSPKDVPTYDMKPEMSAFTVAAEVSARISKGNYNFILVNFANADMVGHTGNYEAAVKSMEAIDKCLSQVIGAALLADYHVLLTADHGNAEEMRVSNGQIHTQHTLNPVPLIWIAPDTANSQKSSRKSLRNGGLQDMMPTLCQLMHLPIPECVTGKTLITEGDDLL